jgi:hypothetical protein
MHLRKKLFLNYTLYIAIAIAKQDIKGQKQNYVVTNQLLML